MSYRRPAFEALAYVCPTTRPAGECMGGRLAMSLAGSQPTPSEAAGPIAATAVLDQRPFQKADTPAQESHLNVVLHEKWLCCLVRLFVGIGESGINLTASRRRFQ